MRSDFIAQTSVIRYIFMFFSHNHLGRARHKRLKKYRLQEKLVELYFDEDEKGFIIDHALSGFL